MAAHPAAGVAPPDRRVLHHLVAEQAAARPAAVALLDGDAEVSYGEVVGRANAVAHALAERGEGPGRTVGVCLERSVDYVVAVLGVLSSGAACLPVSPDDPPARVAAALRSGGTRTVVTARRYAGGPHLDPATTLALDERPDLAAGVAAPPPAAVTGADTAFVFSTSGSTGVPKGVVLSHAACAAQTPWIAATFGLGPADRHVLKMSVNFVGVLRCLMWPLTTGGSTVVVPVGTQGDLGRLVRLTARHGVTVTTFIPSVLRLFLEQPQVGSCTALRHVLCGGEPLPAALQDRYFARLPGDLHNVYGLSEAPLVSHWQCRPGDTRPAPIGRPVPGVALRVLDEAGRPAPAGEMGELCVGGIGVTSGFLGRPDLDAERFVPDPEGEVDRLYRTGDLARRTPDGQLGSVGRADQMAKVRGFRMELGEVESALGRHPQVRQAVAKVHTTPAGERQLVAYLVATSADAVAAARLREHLGALLPDYMVPARFVRLDELPLLPNGKVDRAALPEPGDSRGDSDQPYVAPRDELEAGIARIWADVLDTDQVGVDDAFLDLGGDSLRAVEVSLRMEQLLGRELPFEVFIGAATVAELARATREHLARTGGA